MLSIIVAVANNNVIGKNNKLIWNIPEDLKRFKEITTGKKIIMGRKTFESIGKILPNRFHIILSKKRDNKIEENEKILVINDVALLKEYIASEEECFVIGGETIYKLLLPYAKKIYLTKIYHDFDGDTFFPKIDKTKWKEIFNQKVLKNEENSYNYEYITYIRK